LVPRALLQLRNILVNFVEGRALAAQAMALDHRTMLGPSTENPERRDPSPTARLFRRYARAAYRLRQQPAAMGSGHCPDHTSAVPQEPAQDRLSVSGFELMRPRCTGHLIARWGNVSHTGQRGGTWHEFYGWPAPVFPSREGAPKTGTSGPRGAVISTNPVGSTWPHPFGCGPLSCRRRTEPLGGQIAS
jgi:hypothetical protein